LISVRGSAAYTLGRLGDARALEALYAAHRSPRELVWVSALVAIFVALWAYVSFWWGVWVVAAIVVGWLFMMFLFFRKLPLD
jgi:HEAT repeat protein